MRGMVGGGLNPLLAIDFASALGTFLDHGKVVVGIDSRISSEMLYHAACAALTSCGINVHYAGVAPAPVVHFLTPHLKADGAMLLGAGHQGAGWNALVPLAADGSYLNSILVQELLDIYHSHQYKICPWNELGKVSRINKKEIKAYFDFLGSLVDVKAISAKNFTVIADFCNGSGAPYTKMLAETLGINLIPINNIVSGILPHSPEPRPRSAFQVNSIMKPLKADIGFVFNSDMSRGAIVTDSGETLSEEYTFPIVADYILEKHGRQQRVITNQCSTRTIDDIVKRHGGEIYKTHVGQAAIADKMLEVDAILGGEGSGSVIMRGGVRGSDCFLAMALTLEAMAVRNMTSTQLAGRLPRYHIVKQTINCPSARAYSLIRNLRNHFPDAEVIEDDGFKFIWHDGWISLRNAATEPVIRMISEWKTMDEALDRALRVRGLLERLEAL